MLVWLVSGLAAPLLVTVAPVDFSLSNNAVVAAPRDSYAVSSPVVLAQLPMLAIERGSIYPVDPAGRAKLDNVSSDPLAGGTTRLMIEGASILVGGDQSGIQGLGNAAPSPLLEALAGLQFEAATLRRASITVALPDGRAETLTEVDAEISHKRRISLSVKGSGVVRGQAVAFELTSALAADKSTNATVPLKLTLRNARLTAAFDGRAVLGPTPQLLGAIEFSIPNIRQAARWFGAAWPGGSGLRDVTGRGQLEWTAASLALNKAAFRMDDNDATGTLHFRFADARPSIGGTLALKVLDLSRYFPDTSLALSTVGKAREALAAAEISLPLAQHFDADLRVSADRVKLGAVQLGRSAATLSLANGRLLADLGAFEFDGGRGSGQVAADFNGRLPRMTLRGKLEDVDLARASSAVWGHVVVAGRGTLTTDLTATGFNGRELVDSATGKATANVRGGGTRIGVDLAAVAIAAEKRAVEGWSAGARGQTPFDEIDARFNVNNGVLTAEDMRAGIKDEVMAITGTADLSTGRLNVTFTRGPLPQVRAGVTAPATRPEPVTKLRILGPWAAPIIRNEAFRGRLGQTPDRSSGSAAMVPRPDSNH